MVKAQSEEKELKPTPIDVVVQEKIEADNMKKLIELQQGQIQQLNTMAQSIGGIAKKLTKMMEICNYVQKTGKNAFHGYKYAMAAAVLEKVNDACVQIGVASIPRFTIIDRIEHTNARGNKEYILTVQCNMIVVDVDTLQQAEVIAFGTGQDAGDKAVAKAQTMALKYAWMTLLNISTGDDPEADTGVDERNTKPAPPSEVSTIDLRQELAKIIEEKGISNQIAKNMMIFKFKKQSSKELTIEELKDLIETIKKYKGETDGKEQ